MTESLGTLPKDLLLALEDNDSDGDSDDEAELFVEDLDLDSELEEEEDEKLEDEPRLFISREHAKANYAKAGREVQEKESEIKVEDYAAIMDKGVEQLFDEIVKDVELPYRPVPFQRVATVALGGGKNVVMVMGTGEGKMTVALLGSLLVRKTHGHPMGVTLVTQPLTGLQLEQLSNPILKVAVMSMSGRLTADTADDGSPQAKLSCSLEDLLAGKFPILMCHPDSFSSPLCQRVLTQLERHKLLNMVVIDEFDTNRHWKTFRPEMMRQSTGLRNYAREGAPMMVMTASAKEKEMKEIVKFMGLREPPVLITSNPVQSHIKLSVVRRPSNAFGLAGREGADGVLKPGLWALLNELYFREFFRDRAEGREPKHAIIFCRGLRVMSKLHSHLSTISGYCDARDSPFVMFHSDITPATEQIILDRMDDYQLLLSTTRGLLGYNFKKIDIIIFLQPFDESAFMLQGGGRGGRKQLDGLKRCVQVYQLWNPEDLTRRNKLMTEEVRKLCRTGATACTRDFLKQSFHIGKGRPVREPEDQRGQSCCHYHDLQAMEMVEG